MEKIYLDKVFYIFICILYVLRSEKRRKTERERERGRSLSSLEGKFSWSFRILLPGRPFGPCRVWSGTRNTHFYQTLRALERAGWKPISYSLVGIHPGSRFTLFSPFLLYYNPTPAREPLFTCLHPFVSSMIFICIRIYGFFSKQQDQRINWWNS